MAVLEWGRGVRRMLPRGGALPPDLWETRHHTILIVLWLHVLGIPIFGLFVGRSIGHVLIDALPVALLGACASLRTASGHGTRAVLASFGLLTASSVLVHVSGGNTEMHFHFFVMVALIALYQDWRPFLGAIGFVGLHHAVFGVLAPGAVYGHEDAVRRPLVWAVIHAVFVLAASAAQVTTWRVTETQHERSEEALRASERWFRTLIERSTDGVTVIGADGTVAYDSPSIERVFHVPNRTGQLGSYGVHPDDLEQLQATLDSLDAGGSALLEHRIVTSDGIRWVESRVTDLRGVPGVEGFVVNFRDISERRELEQQLAHQAFHDALTGLPNRTLFADRIARAISAQGRGGKLQAAVLFIDLDDFKLVNDGMGHVTGDEVLIEAGRRIAGCLRPGDTCARLGGDEFGVLLEEVGEDAYDAAVRLLEALEGEVVTTAGSIRLEASVGLAYAGPDDVVDDVVRNADLAMYRAKARGKARLEAFEDGMRELAHERIALKADMSRALEAGEFVPHYQPVVSLAHGRAVGVEALVRWEHPQRGRLAPIAFIELAEESGSIIDIGRVVLRQACADAVTWPGSLGLSVNLSARQLQDAHLVADVADVLRDTGLAPQRLTLEITESVLVADPDAAAAVLGQLKALGVSVALDDFGTGYSSLSYLNRFPVDTLKIDKSFIDALALGGTNEAALLQAIVGLGRTLELNVVAEGIEDADQLAVLQALGCGLGQGYLFARPMPNADLLDWVPSMVHAG